MDDERYNKIDRRYGEILAGLKRDERVLNWVVRITFTLAALIVLGLLVVLALYLVR